MECPAVARLETAPNAGHGEGVVPERLDEIQRLPVPLSLGRYSGRPNVLDGEAEEIAKARWRRQAGFASSPEQQAEQRATRPELLGRRH
jgi:hypothetical protein